MHEDSDQIMNMQADKDMFSKNDLSAFILSLADPERVTGLDPLPFQITSGYRFPKKFWYGPRSNCFSRAIRKALCDIL